MSFPFCDRPCVMMRSRTFLVFSVVFLCGAFAPLVLLSKGEGGDPSFLGKLLLSGAVLAACVVFLFWRSLSAHIKNKEKDLLNQADGKIQDFFKVTEKVEEDLKINAAHLDRVAESHQDRASSVVTSAERATETATLIASATEELNSSINEIGRQVDEAASVSETARTRSADANKASDQLANGMEEVGSIANLIREIAEKTNLLALNATIEAARAGEAGKGFAVVANEVKGLAAQTAQATEQIESKVTTVKESSDAVKQTLDVVSGIINKIGEITTSIKGGLEEQMSATHEIASSAQNSSRAMEEVTGTIGHMLVTTEEIRHASETVTNSARELYNIKTSSMENRAS